MSKQVKIIDPPSGWRYGFPKEHPGDEIKDIYKWLVENGYPQSQIDIFTKGNMPYGVYYVEVKEK